MKPILILGLGNLLRTDDGVGVHAVNMLNDSGKLPETVDAVDAGTCATDLPALLMGRKRIVIIDALEADAEPGTVYKFPAAYLSGAGENPGSMHEAGVVFALKAIQMLGERPDVEVVGVVPRDIVTMGTEPTPKVRNALPHVVDIVLKTVSEEVPNQ